MRYLAIKRGEKCRFYGIGTEPFFMADFQLMLISAADGKKVLAEVFAAPGHTLRGAHKLCDLAALGNVVGIRREQMQRGFQPEQAKAIMAELFRRVVK